MSQLQLKHAHPLRKWFVAIVLVWVALAFLLWGRLAQDAVPYQVAGDLVHDHPHDVYASPSGDLFDLTPPFAAKWCQLAPAGTDCPQVAVAFVSAPMALPFSVVLAAPGAEPGILLARLLAAGSLAVGMFVLWNRLAGKGPDAPRYLVVTALLLTPMASVPITLGQTSPYLFLLACLGVQRTTRPGRRWFVAATWALTISLKLFPAALGLVLVGQRRWKLLVATIASLAVLVGLTLLVAPTSIWADFVHLSVRVAKHSVGNPYSGSLDNLAHEIWHPLTENGALAATSLVLRAAAALGLWWWGVRHADDDSQWAYGWLALMLVVPLVWWHYLWVAVAALGIVLAGKGVDRKWLVALPIMAAATVPMSLANSAGSSWVVAQSLFLVVAAVAVPAIARTSRTPAAEN
jgi:hypothetical protein